MNRRKTKLIEFLTIVAISLIVGSVLVRAISGDSHGNLSSRATQDATKRRDFIQSKANIYGINQLKARLTDPESIQLRNLAYYRQAETADAANYVVCGEMNSRNGFGGYSGYVSFTSSVFTIDNSGVPTFVADLSAAFIDGQDHHQSFLQIQAKTCRGTEQPSDDVSGDKQSSDVDDYGPKGRQICRLEGMNLAGDFTINIDGTFTGWPDAKARDQCDAMKHGTSRCIHVCKEGFETGLSHFRQLQSKK